MAWQWTERYGWQDSAGWPEPDYDTPLFDQVCQETGSGDDESAVYREGLSLDELKFGSA